MIPALKIPNQVIDSDWKDDIDFESYKNESDYVRPESVKNATANQAKKRNVKIGHIALFSKNDKIIA